MSNTLQAALTTHRQGESLNKISDGLAWQDGEIPHFEVMDTVKTLCRMRADVARARTDVAKAIERLKYFAAPGYEGEDTKRADDGKTRGAKAMPVCAGRRG